MVWILRYKLVIAKKRIVMNEIADTYPKEEEARRRVVVLFLLISSVVTSCTLSAQSFIVWQSFNSGFGNSKGDDVSLLSLAGQPFIGNALGAGISLSSGFGSYGSSITSVKDLQGKIPLAYALSQNYPNPFNPSTVIAFAVPEASHVSLEIYDIVGRNVSTLVNEDLLAGNYRSTLVADRLSSGVYFYRIVAASKSNKSRIFIETKKLMLVK
jgi:hypothetical protein